MPMYNPYEDSDCAAEAGLEKPLQPTEHSLTGPIPEQESASLTLAQSPELISEIEVPSGEVLKSTSEPSVGLSASTDHGLMDWFSVIESRFKTAEDVAVPLATTHAPAVVEHQKHSTWTDGSRIGSLQSRQFDS